MCVPNSNLIISEVQCITNCKVFLYKKYRNIYPGVIQDIRKNSIHTSLFWTLIQPFLCLKVTINVTYTLYTKFTFKWKKSLNFNCNNK